MIADSCHQRFAAGKSARSRQESEDPAYSWIRQRLPPVPQQKTGRKPAECRQLLADWWQTSAGFVVAL